MIPKNNNSYALEKIPADKRALKKKFMHRKFFTPTPVISNGRP